VAQDVSQLKYDNREYPSVTGHPQAESLVASRENRGIKGPESGHRPHRSRAEEQTGGEIPRFRGPPQKDLRRQGVAGSGYRHRGARPLLTIYADTSFFVSLYVKDVHSADADQRLSSGGRPFLTPLHLAEWAHAMAQQVFRRQMSSAEANRVRRELDEDRSAGVWETVGVPETAMDICADLGFRYGPKLGVRTLDTLHVACALELRAERFWTFDDCQTKLAKAVGLDTR
jgi:predicted nucleic acid-binding protein